MKSIAMKKIFFLGLILALLSTVASAQGREAIRKERIAHGIRNKQLTRAEVLELRRVHTRRHIAQRRAYRDGRITPAERQRLTRLHKRENRRIFIAKHNARRRLI